MTRLLAVVAFPLCLVVSGCSADSENRAVNSSRAQQAAHPLDDELESRCDDLAGDQRTYCRQLMVAARPSASLVDRVESRLASHPCVGDLRRWQRLYSFAVTRPSFTASDQSRVAFVFRQAGVYGFVSGRRITAPEICVQIDDRNYNMVSGYYDLRSERLVIEFCLN